MKYKKSNIDTLKDYVSGVRPRVQVGYGVPDARHALGDVWTDSKGITWKQKENYRVRVNKQADLIRRLTMKICKTCQTELNTFASRLDKKMYDMTGNCSDCQIKAETKMRIDGTYAEYEKKKVLLNQLSYLEDIMKEIRDRYSKIDDDKIVFQNVLDEKNAKFVDNEKWTPPNKSEARLALKKDYRMVFTEVLKIRRKLSELK